MSGASSSSARDDGPAIIRCVTAPPNGTSSCTSGKRSFPTTYPIQGTSSGSPWWTPAASFRKSCPREISPRQGAWSFAFPWSDATANSVRRSARSTRRRSATRPCALPRVPDYRPREHDHQDTTLSDARLRVSTRNADALCGMVGRWSAGLRQPMHCHPDRSPTLCRSISHGTENPKRPAQP